MLKVPLNFRLLSRQLSTKYTINEVLKIKPDALKINGWVTNIRKMKKFTFLEVNDGSCKSDIQVVLDHKVTEVNVGSAVSVEGKLGETPRGQLEIQATTFSLINPCNHSSYPFSGKHAVEYVRDFPHLRTRTKQFAAVMRLRHAANKGFRDFLDHRGFLSIHTPLITSNDCEGSGEVFVLNPENQNLLKNMQREGVKLEEAYFDKTAYMTVSGQLHLEAMNLGLEKVYTFNPAFRAENSKSPCHLAEFTMLEAEVAFMDSLEEITGLVDEMVKSVTQTMLDQRADDLEYVRQGSIDDSWITRKTPTISFKEAIEILETHKTSLKTAVKPAEGITKEQELFLVQHFAGPIFVARWPKEIKSFYMKENTENPSLVDCFDFLVPEVGELVGGSCRESNYDRLRAKLPTDSLQWYLDLRKFGSANTAGFGLGFERYLQWVMNVKNIRDVIPFPRWPHNCDT